MTWPRVPLGQIAEIERNGIEPSEIETGTLYVGLENIRSGGGFDSVRAVDAGELASNKFAFDSRHLLYGKLRPYLAKIARPNFEGICSTDIVPVLPGPMVDRDFLARFLLLPESVASANARATGANLPRLSPTALAELPVPLPPLAEQRRIADILDRADAMRAKRREAIALLESLAPAAFVKMFGDPASNPTGWPRASLGDVILSASDGPHVSPEYADAGVPFLSTRHIRRGEIVWEDLKYLTLEDAETQWKKCRPARGDLLYTKGGTTGLAAVVPDDRQFAVWVHVALLKPDRAIVDSTWLAFMLNSAFCYQQSQVLTHGIANRDLGLKRMVRIRLYLPPLGLQREFAARVAALDKLKAAHRASLAEMDALFASLQHRAFRGEL